MSDETQIREMLSPGQRLKLLSADGVMQPRYFGPHQVLQLDDRGVMTVSESDGSKMFLPVGCQAGRTIATLLEPLPGQQP